MKFFKTQIPQNNPFFIIIVLISIILLGLIFGGLLFWVLYFFHEGGHVVVAFVYNFLNSQTTVFNFEYAPLAVPNSYLPLFVLLRPVQANVNGDHWIIGWGGILFPVMFSFLISSLIFLKNVHIPHKIVIFSSIPIIVLSEEVIMNCFCGTDCRNLIFCDNICPVDTAIFQEQIPILLSVPIIIILSLLILNNIRNFNPN